jgi:hypothetical protein
LSIVSQRAPEGQYKDVKFAAEFLQSRLRKAQIWRLSIRAKEKPGERSIVDGLQIKDFAFDDDAEVTQATGETVAMVNTNLASRRRDR